MNSSNNRNNKAAAAIEFSCPKGFVPDRQVTDLDLQALADGELEGEEKRSLMGAILLNPLLLERLDEIITQRNLVRASWRPGKDLIEH